MTATRIVHDMTYLGNTQRFSTNKLCETLWLLAPRPLYKEYSVIWLCVLYTITMYYG